MEELIQLKNQANARILDAGNLEELNDVKMSFLGKSGSLTEALKKIKDIDPEKRREFGQLANEIKRSIEVMIDQKESELSTTHKNSKKEILDVTLPGIRPTHGHLHLVTQAIEEISEIFARIGFTRVRYPEVEWDWYAFGALNFPDNHPARDDWETFFIDEKPSGKYGPMLLTPHTSSGQIREMERSLKELNKSHEFQPIKMLNIAKTYRRQSDISHTSMFHQFETLYIDEKVSITHLKGVLDYFVKSWFGTNRRSRIRPYHFQFTEPSFETDISCGVCNGTGKIKGEKCRLCKGGWLELGGAGMVHPNVIKAAGLDPKKYSGFASGWGVERVLMMREGLEIDDLRMLYSNNLDFLNQF